VAGLLAFDSTGQYTTPQSNPRSPRAPLNSQVKRRRTLPIQWMLSPGTRELFLTGVDKRVKTLLTSGGVVSRRVAWVSQVCATF
jgi:hypothetical protein